MQKLRQLSNNTCIFTVHMLIFLVICNSYDWAALYEVHYFSESGMV